MQRIQEIDTCSLHTEMIGSYARDKWNYRQLLKCDLPGLQKKTIYIQLGNWKNPENRAYKLNTREIAVMESVEVRYHNIEDDTRLIGVRLWW